VLGACWGTQAGESLGFFSPSPPLSSPARRPLRSSVALTRPSRPPPHDHDLLTTDMQTAHAVVAQSLHVCSCLRADGSHCCVSSPAGATPLFKLQVSHPVPPTSTMQSSAAPWPRRERGRRQRDHPPSMSPSSPPVRPLQNPHAALSSLRTHRLRMPSSHITLPASLVAPALPIAHCPCLSAPLCTVYRSAFALLHSPVVAACGPLPSPSPPLSAHKLPAVGSQSLHVCSDSMPTAGSLHVVRNGAFAAPLPTSPAPPPHHPTPPGPGEKGDIDGGRPCHLRPLPRRLFSLSCRCDGPSPAPSCPILTARRCVLPLAPARKGM
jgi:hypothetical protein